MQHHEIMWECVKEHWKDLTKQVCEGYKQGNIKEYFENGELVGFSVWHDEGNIRYLDAAYNLGKDKKEIIREWYRTIDTNKTLRACVNKTNDKMIKFYTRNKFSIIEDIGTSYILERKQNGI